MDERTIGSLVHRPQKEVVFRLNQLESELRVGVPRIGLGEELLRDGHLQIATASLILILFATRSIEDFIL